MGGVLNHRHHTNRGGIAMSYDYCATCGREAIGAVWTSDGCVAFCEDHDPNRLDIDEYEADGEQLRTPDIRVGNGHCRWGDTQIQNSPDIRRESEREKPSAFQRDIYDRVDGAVQMRRQWDAAHNRSAHPLVRHFPIDPPPPHLMREVDRYVSVRPLMVAAVAVASFCVVVWACVALQRWAVL
jgi:hypothetical protein